LLFPPEHVGIAAGGLVLLEPLLKPHESFCGAFLPLGGYLSFIGAKPDRLPVVQGARGVFLPDFMDRGLELTVQPLLGAPQIVLGKL
jgi:hypothetical protein